ncbi:hypothetical protein SKAU_G00018310, partial [Synaphobranchus kaupii]
ERERECEWTLLIPASVVIILQNRAKYTNIFRWCRRKNRRKDRTIECSPSYTRPSLHVCSETEEERTSPTRIIVVS